MTALEVVLGAALAVAAVLLVALPYLRDAEPDDDRLDTPTEAEGKWLELAAERDRSLAALKELEFDHRTGKVSDEDYRELLPQLRQAAAAALRALDDSAAAERVGTRPMNASEPLTPAPAPVPEPSPPPDEGSPPTPVTVPEPYPPPDEATLPEE